jgi:hypothetical protein
VGWRDDINIEWEVTQQKRRVAQLQLDYDVTVADRLARALQISPNMDPRLITSLVLGGGDEQLVQKTSKAVIERMIADGSGRDGDRNRNDPELENDDNRSVIESLGGNVMKTLKAASRSAFTVFDSVTETAVGVLGAPFSPGARQRIQEQGFFEGLGDYLSDIPQATSLWEVGSQIRDRGFRGVDIGSGFFVGGEVEADQTARQRELVGTVEKGGTTYAWTPGRGFADLLADNGIIQEDSWLWNVSSGIIDATIAIGTDPTNLIAGVGWGDELVKGVKAVGSRRAAKYVRLIERADQAETFGDIVSAERLRRRAMSDLGADFKGPRVRTAGPAEVAIRDQLLREIGANSGNIRSVDSAQFLSYLTNRSGRRLVERMVGETDAATIFDLHRGKIGPTAIRDLKNARSPEEVIAVYMRAFMEPASDLSNMVKAVPNLGLFRVTDMGMWVRRNINSHTKLGRMMPESSILDLSKPQQYLQRLDQLLKVFPTGLVDDTTRFSQAIRSDLMNKAVDALASGDNTAVYALNNQISDTFAKMFRKQGYTEDTVRSLTQWSRESNQFMAFAMNQIASGERPDKIPLLVTQLLSSGAAVIDPAQMQNAIRRGNTLRTLLRTKGVAGSRYFNKVAELDDAKLALDELGLNAAATPSQIREAQKKVTGLQRQLDKMKTSEQGFAVETMNGLTLAGDFVMSGVWKPLQLVRGAFIARVVGEETLRTINSGTFGGRGRTLDYFLAAKRGGRYTQDAVGRRFEVAQKRMFRKTDELAEKDALVEDLTDSLNEARRAGRTTEVDRLKSEIDKVQSEVDFLLDELANATEFFHKATLANQPGAAFEALTKNPKKILYQSGQAGNVRRTDPEQVGRWVDAMADRLVKYNADPVMRQLARGGPSSKTKFTVNGVSGTITDHVRAGRIANDTEAMAYWLMGGEGRPYLNKIANAYRAGDQQFDPENMDDVVGWLDKLNKELRYLVGGKVDPVTGNMIGFDADLLEVIATGRFQGRRVEQLLKKERRTQLDAGYVDRLRRFADEDNAPEWIEHLGDNIYGEAKEGLMSQIAGWFFTQAYGQASDKLARSPVFRRVYWKQVAQMADRLDPDEAAKLLAQAKNAKLQPKLLKDLETRLSIAKGTAKISDIDDVAKGAALAATRDLLFDASVRGATFDQMRLIIPFGDAWKEVMTTWGRLFVQQRGMNLYRTLRNAEALMGADAGPLGAGDMYGYDELTGEFSPTLDGVSENFIYTDPIAKDKRVMVPWSRQLSQAMLRAGGLENVTGVGMGIPVRNMSIAGGILPGFGPVADRFVNTLVPEDPSYEWVRRAIFPFGAPAEADVPAGQQGVEEVLLPPWARKLSAVIPRELPVAGWLANMVLDKDNDPQYQSTLSQMYASLMTSGAYSSSFEDQQRAQADAERAADKILAFRGLLQGFAPGAPLATYFARTEEGDVMGALLVDQLKKLEEQFIEQGDSPDKALGLILDTYGPDVWLYSAPVSGAQYKGIEATEEYLAFYQRNRDTIDQYGLIGGFLGPVGGEFSIEAYGALSREGVYQIGSPQQRYEAAALQLGFLAYNKFRDSLPPEQFRTNMDKILLSRVRDSIEETFNVDLENPQRRSERERQINQAESLIRAADANVEGPARLVDNETGESLRVYLTARARIDELARSAGEINWRQSKRGMMLRDGLRMVGRELSERDPGFSKMYQFVFDRELLDDLEVALR